MGNFALRTRVTAAHAQQPAPEASATSSLRVSPLESGRAQGVRRNTTTCSSSTSNQIEFSGLLQIGINQWPYDRSNPFVLTLSCPEAVSLSVPGPDFRLTLETTDGIQSTTCASGQTHLLEIHADGKSPARNLHQLDNVQPLGDLR